MAEQFSILEAFIDVSVRNQGQDALRVIESLESRIQALSQGSRSIDLRVTGGGLDGILGDQGGRSGREQFLDSLRQRIRRITSDGRAARDALNGISVNERFLQQLQRAGLLTDGLRNRLENANRAIAGNRLFQSLTRDLERFEQRVNGTTFADRLQREIDQLRTLGFSRQADDLQDRLASINATQAANEIRDFNSALRQSDGIARTIDRIRQLRSALSNGIVDSRNIGAANRQLQQLVDRLRELRNPGQSRNPFQNLESGLRQIEQRALNLQQGGTTEGLISRLQREIAALPRNQESITFLNRLNTAVRQIDTQKAENEFRDIERQLRRTDPILRYQTEYRQLQRLLQQPLDNREIANAANRRLAVLADNIQRGGQAAGRSRARFGGLNNFIFQLAFAAEDAQFGLRGLSNNIPVLIQNLLFLRGTSLAVGASLAGLAVSAGVGFLALRQAVREGNEEAVQLNRNIRDIAAGLAAIGREEIDIAFNFVTSNGQTSRFIESLIVSSGATGAGLSALLGGAGVVGQEQRNADFITDGGGELEDLEERLREARLQSQGFTDTQIELELALARVSDRAREQGISAEALAQTQQNLTSAFTELQNRTARRLAVEGLQELREETEDARLRMEGLTEAEIAARRELEEYQERIEELNTGQVRELTEQFRQQQRIRQDIADDRQVQGLTGVDEVRNLQEQIRLLEEARGREEELDTTRERVTRRLTELNEQLQNALDPDRQARQSLIESLQTPLENARTSVAEIFRLLSRPQDIQIRQRALANLRNDLRDATRVEPLNIQTLDSTSLQAGELFNEIQASIQGESFVDPVVAKLDELIRAVQAGDVQPTDIRAIVES